MLRVCLPIRRINRFCLPLLHTFPLDNGHAAIYPCQATREACGRLANAAKLVLLRRQFDFPAVGFDTGHCRRDAQTVSPGVR